MGKEKFCNRLKTALELSQMKQRDLCAATGIPKSAMSQYLSGNFEPKSDRLEKLAAALNVSEAWLMGYDTSPERVFTDDSKSFTVSGAPYLRSLPLYESVSAGFGASADDRPVGRIHACMRSDAEAESTLFIRVVGNSMYPKIEDGDIIQVRRQSSVDSGSIAVVLLDGEEGLVKKTEYGDGFIRLVSLNPEYAPRLFEGSETERIRVVGLVKRIIKEC